MGKYGLYRAGIGLSENTMYFPNETGWHMYGLGDEDIWLKYNDGWDDALMYVEGAALVAPLTILYWEKDDA